MNNVHTGTTAGAPPRTDLLTATLDDAPRVERVQISRIDLAPGQTPGAHTHPCDVVGVVLSGSIQLQIGDQDERVLRAGDPFFEPRNTPITRFGNASSDQPASFQACYLLAPNQTELITMTPPSGS
jgi:quercetin dioxygenase-like cupin family protein